MSPVTRVWKHTLRYLTVLLTCPTEEGCKAPCGDASSQVDYATPFELPKKIRQQEVVATVVPDAVASSNCCNSLQRHQLTEAYFQ